MLRLFSWFRRCEDVADVADVADVRDVADATVSEPLHVDTPSAAVSLAFSG